MKTTCIQCNDLRAFGSMCSIYNVETKSNNYSNYLGLCDYEVKVENEEREKNMRF